MSILADTNVLIVDDHHIIRRTLRQWLTGKFPTVNIVDLNSGEEAVTYTTQNPVNLVLMDVHLPGIDGIEATRKIKTQCPELPVIILTVQEVDRYRTSATEAGADGYVIKRQMYTDLIPAIDSVLNSIEKNKSAWDFP